jgi:hypothetical protein
MPIHNNFVRDAQGNFHPAGLSSAGALFNIEIQLHPALAQALAQQNQPIPAGLPGMAMIDTGASGTCVHEPILQQLGINPVGVVQGLTAAGPVQQSLYPARLVFPATGWTFDVPNVVGVNLAGQVAQIVPPQPIIALLGRDLLTAWTLTWNGPGGFWTVAF